MWIAAARALAIATMVGSPWSTSPAAAASVVGATVAIACGHARQQPAALVETHRVGADLADVLQRDRLDRDEAVLHAHDRLGDDGERRVVEQIVGLVDRPGQRALDRQHTVGAVAVRHRRDDVAERRVRDQPGGGEEAVGTGGGVGAFTSGIGNGCVVGSHASLSERGTAGDQLVDAGGRRVRRLAPKGEGARKEEGVARGLHGRQGYVTLPERATRRRRPRRSSPCRRDPGVGASVSATSTAASSRAASSARSSP